LLLKKFRLAVVIQTDRKMIVDKLERAFAINSLNKRNSDSKRKELI